MAKRARLTVDDVLQQCADSDEECPEYEYDPEEPVMEGSDDEFSDLEGDDFDDDINEGDHNPDPMDDSPAAPITAGSSSLARDCESTWTTTIKRVPIQPFTSPTGPIQNIPSSPLEVFNLFFSPDLYEKIVRVMRTLKQQWVMTSMKSGRR